MDQCSSAALLMHCHKSLLMRDSEVLPEKPFTHHRKKDLFFNRDLFQGHFATEKHFLKNS